MKVAEVADALREITENSITKLTIESWISVELGRICARKPYWWRKAALTFASAAGTPTYDLAGGVPPIAADFLQMASPLYEFSGTQKVAELTFIGHALGILQMVRDTSGGQPSQWTVEPGTSQVLRLSPIADGVRSYSGLYYRAPVISWNSPNDDLIPVLPPAFHYVLYAAMERRAFFYLYGQKDPRATLAAQAEMQCLSDLDGYKAPTTLQAKEWRSGNPDDFVSSTH